jgi:hypothetical protein
MSGTAERVRTATTTAVAKPTKAWWQLVVFRMPPEDVDDLKKNAHNRRLSVSDVIRCSLVDSGVLRMREA